MDIASLNTALTATRWDLVSVPIISALVGWGTNTIAVKMIFRPLKPVRVLGFPLHGLIPRRQKELAEQLGETIETNLISHKDIQKVLQSPDIENDVRSLMEQQVDAFIANQVSSNPLIGMFLQGSVAEQIKSALLKQIQGAIPNFLDALLLKVENTLSFKDIIREKVESFDLLKLEQIIYKISARELKAIEVLGGILGFLIGLLQVGILLASE